MLACFGIFVYLCRQITDNRNLKQNRYEETLPTKHLDAPAFDG